MTRQEFLSLAQECERECCASPGAYRLRTLFWTALAWFALPLLLTTAALALVAMLAVFVGIVYLTDRMAALPQDRATDRLFGEKAPEIRRRVGAQWCKDIRHHWHVAHEEVRDAAAELAEIQRKPEGSRTQRDQWLLLNERMRTSDPEACEAELRRLVATAPDLEDPLMELTALLARRGSAECLEFASRLTDMNTPRAIRFVADSVFGHLSREGRGLEFDEWRPWFEHLMTKAEERVDEAFAVDPSYPFLRSHSLRSPQAKRLARQLHERGVTRAWLAEKMNLDPLEPPLFLLIVDRKRSALEWDSNGTWEQFLSDVLDDIAFPHRLLLLPATKRWRSFVDAADVIPHSRLLPR